MILELRNTILEMIATGESLSATLERICLEVEAVVPGIVCSVLSVRRGRLHPLAGPSLPAEYYDAVDNGASESDSGTGATAVTDFVTEARWEDFKALVEPLGFQAWSTPILSNGQVVATFAFYYEGGRGPSEPEQRIVDACVHLCAIAIERNERVNERQRLTYTDVLTGLPNRARFSQILAEQAQDTRSSWGILLADIDNLKLVNDTFGHAAGDDLIRQVAERIASVMAPERTFRLGGDEFAAIIHAGSDAALNLEAAKILAVLKPSLECDGHTVFPAATLGGAVARRGYSEDMVRQNADLALYHAKEHSRGQFVAYSAELGTAFARRFRAVSDVGMALADDRIDAYYQPIIHLESGEIVGFEALCRMIMPTGDIVPAIRFHEATKDARVAADLTRRMLSHVAADVRRWIDAGLPIKHVGINLSAADFHSGDLHQRLTGIFASVGIPFSHVILEVTESVYIGQRDYRVADQIKALRTSGFRVALDDFGTGFASLTHLLSVPVDIIKIDKTFVDRLVDNDAGLVIVEGVLGIAAKLGIRVVAEGIETASQATHLIDLGCDLGQGYLFSEAVDRDTARTLLQRFGRHDGRPRAGLQKKEAS